MQGIGLQGINSIGTLGSILGGFFKGCAWVKTRVSGYILRLKLVLKEAGQVDSQLRFWDTKEVAVELR